MSESKLITLAIHTMRHASALKSLLEKEGVMATLQNVNLTQPEVSAGVRVRIHEEDLPVALRIVENPELFARNEDGSPDETTHILVPTDFSVHASNACLMAFHIAKAHESKIHLLHSFLDPIYSKRSQLNDNLSFDNDQIHDSATVHEISEARKRMEEFEAGLVKQIKIGSIPPVKFSHEIREGLPEDAINQYARQHHPMLIIMGTRTAGDKARELVGSVAAEVLDTCRFPIMTIPESTDCSTTNGIRNIVFFSNFDQQDILAIDSMLRLLPARAMDICLVKLPSKKFSGDILFALNRLKDYCLKHYPVHRFEIDTVSIDSVEEDYHRLMTQYNVDLIVVPNKKKNAFARFFNPGVAHRLLFQSDIPMLVVPV